MHNLAADLNSTNLVVAQHGVIRLVMRMSAFAPKLTMGRNEIHGRSSRPMPRGNLARSIAPRMRRKATAPIT